MSLQIMVSIAVGLAVAAGLIYKALMQPQGSHSSNLPQGPGEGEVVGTLEDLEAAEKVVAEGSISEHQMKIYENYERIERLHTSAGFTSDHVNKIVRSLEQAGFDAFFHWQESAMPGTYALMPIGYYELFVARDQADEARKYLASNHSK